MELPPLGYDDESVVPQNQLKVLLSQFEGELTKIQAVFKQNMPGHFNVYSDFEKSFWRFRHSAEELGTDYSYLVEKLIDDYEHFKKDPDETKLEQLFSDVKSLELLLAD